METIRIGPHEECVLLTSGDFRLAVTTQVGPRIIGGFLGEGDNLFAVLPVEPMESVDTGFTLYGGHRLWHAPEAAPRTYAPDNEPVEMTELADGSVNFSSGIEALTGIEKSFAVRALGNQCFEVKHRLVNRNQWNVELAPWGLSQMAPGGMAVIPQGRNDEANPFAVDRSLHLWPYSSLADERLWLGDRYICLKQNPDHAAPCKIGYACESGWAAYVNQGTALIKHVTLDPWLAYPDRGCNIESYTCDLFCELETLGALAVLEPGDEAIHTELWQTVSGIGSLTSEAAIDDELLPHVHAS